MEKKTIMNIGSIVMLIICVIDLLSGLARHDYITAIWVANCMLWIIIAFIGRYTDWDE